MYDVCLENDFETQFDYEMRIITKIKHQSSAYLILELSPVYMFIGCYECFITGHQNLENSVIVLLFFPHVVMNTDCRISSLILWSVLTCIKVIKNIISNLIGTVLQIEITINYGHQEI